MSISTSGSIAPQHTGELVALSNNDTQASSSDSEELASSLCRAALTSSSVALKRVERDHCPSLGSGNPPLVAKVFPSGVNARPSTLSSPSSSAHR